MIHDIAIYVAIFAAGMLAGYLLKVVMVNWFVNKRKPLVEKTNWRILPLVIMFVMSPFFVNWLMLKSTIFKVYNGDWLAFWGAYIAAIVPFIILLITINSNKAENEYNREAQSNFIKCQVDYSRLDNLNACFSNYICALGQMELGIIAYQAKYEPIISRNKVESILKQANNAYYQLDLSLVLYNEGDQSINAAIGEFHDEYISVLPDICFIINSLIPGNPNEDLAKILDQNPSDYMKIIQIINKGGYNINSNQSEIMYDLINGLDFDNLEKEIKKYILFEKHKIDKQMNDFQASRV